MNNKLKILYVMNVDWSWIRQRPHILAQLLDEKYEVTVLYPKYITRPWRRQKNTRKPRKCIGLFQIPYYEHIPLLDKLHQKIIRKAFASIMSYDMIWLSSPLYIDYVPENYRGKIIYDDMDDIVRIQTNPVIASCIEKAQEEVFTRSDAVFVSSQYLFDHLPKASQEKALLIRNGAFNRHLLPVQAPCPKQKQFVLGYVGTISEWFDFSIIQSCLADYSNLRVMLFGPNTVRIPQISGLYCRGIIEHEQIAAATADIDCLIMPFVLNEITLAVDPVKLYEYISFGKCIISIYYPEIERFKPFVYFYETEEQFSVLIGELIHKGFPPKYNAKMQREFLDENSWNQRFYAIDAAFSTLYKKHEGEK